MDETFGRHAIRRDADCWIIEIGDRERGELSHRPRRRKRCDVRHYGGHQLFALILELLGWTGAVHLVGYMRIASLEC